MNTSNNQPSGVQWFDDIAGGLLSGQITMLSGETGSGKTILACQLSAACATTAKRSSVFVAFEEAPEDIARNMAAFDWNFQGLLNKKVHWLDARLSPETVFSGEFELTGLLSRIAAKAKAKKATLIILDGLDQLLQWLTDPLQKSREMNRIGMWLKENGFTCIVTAKSDTNGKAMAGMDFLQFIVSTVISLDRRFESGGSVRTLRILKRRGSAHGMVSYPYFISAQGIEPVEWRGELLSGISGDEGRVSSGMSRLDTLLDGGYYRGSTVLLSGAPGTGKSTLGALFADQTCKLQKKVLYVAFDEPASHLVRNLKSVNIQLAPHCRRKTLIMQGMSAGALGPEQMFAFTLEAMKRHNPEGLVIDPISAFFRKGPEKLGYAVVRRLVAEARERNITTILTSLLEGGTEMAMDTITGVSTIADTWISLAYLERSGERNRTLSVIKSRGSAHSNQTRELILSSRGCSLSDVYTSGGEVLLGTARIEHEAQYREEERLKTTEFETHRRQLQKVVSEGSLRTRQLADEIEAAQIELATLDEDEKLRRKERAIRQQSVGVSRFADKESAPEFAEAGEGKRNGTSR